MSKASLNQIELRQYLIAVTGLTRNWGVVGKCGIRRKGGYHLDKDDIYSACGRGDDDYSVRRRRDKRGLSENSAGFDFGSKLGQKKLRALTAWLQKQAKAGKLDIQEFLGPSTDGQAYWWSKSTKWEPVLLQHPKTQRSHRTHIHVSFPRDLTHPGMGLPDLITMFEPFFGPRPVELPDDDPIEPPDDPDDGPSEPDPLMERIAELEGLIETSIDIVRSLLLDLEEV